MPDLSQMVHICARCGKQMSYGEKKMLYIYDIVEHKGWRSNLQPKKNEAYNLCPKCTVLMKKIIKRFLGGTQNESQNSAET